MFSRKTLPVWVGLILLSSMFLMGQDSWEPPPPPNPTTQDIANFLAGWHDQIIVFQFEADQQAMDRYDIGIGVYCSGQHVLNTKNNILYWVWVYLYDCLVYVSDANFYSGPIDKPAVIALFENYRSIELSYMEAAFYDHNCLDVTQYLPDLLDGINALFDDAILNIQAL